MNPNALDKNQLYVINKFTEKEASSLDAGGFFIPFIHIPAGLLPEINRIRLILPPYYP